ncbi:MAG: hypothetical protein IPL24_00025 [Bacteroidetes bacterium]|nr:hypothetical protein [Bacteroidota bacterium]
MRLLILSAAWNFLLLFGVIGADKWLAMETFMDSNSPIRVDSLVVIIYHRHTTIYLADDITNFSFILLILCLVEGFDLFQISITFFKTLNLACSSVNPSFSFGSQKVIVHYVS